MKNFLLSFAAATLAILMMAWVVVTQPFVSPMPSRPPAADAERLHADVRYLSETTYPRSFDQPKKLAAAAGYIRNALLATGARVEEQEVLVEGERFRNIVAHFGPEQGRLLIVGAHYDSHGEVTSARAGGKAFTRDTHTPGADDNASGVAGLLELARLLAKNPPPRPVELVAYTLEEPPHFRSENMGSARHAASMASSGRAVELMISLEMIGYFSDAPGSQEFPFPGMGLLYPTTGNYIAVVSRLQDWAQTRRLKAVMAGASQLPVYSINAVPAVPGVDFSDHQSYWNRDIPAVMVTDTAFNRNTEYHLAGDTHDRLDYRRMAMVVQGIHSFLVRPKE
jgi:Zn-dependent M28 family amino/carboxypeptidase